MSSFCISFRYPHSNTFTHWRLYLEGNLAIFLYKLKKTIYKPQNTCVKENKLLLLCRLRKGSLLDSPTTQATDARLRVRLVPGEHRRKALGPAGFGALCEVIATVHEFRLRCSERRRKSKNNLTSLSLWVLWKCCAATTPISRAETPSKRRLLLTEDKKHK